MSLYYEAAAILANSDNVGGSLKSRIYNKKDLKSTPGQLFALIAETSKWSLVLKDVIEKCKLLAEEKKLTPILALLLSHDLLLAKNGVAAPANHVLKLAITRHKARLSAELTKARIRHGFSTLEAFKEAVNDGGLDKEDGNASKSRHPRWVRVNTIKTTLKEQLATTFAGYTKTGVLEDVLTAPKSSKVYYEDPNIPNLLALPSKVDLSRSIAYTKGQIIFQDKASCFPAYLLDPTPDDGDVIDATAAPGNKTTHLAAIVSDRRQPGEEQKVIAFERDKGRTFTLQKMVKLASADSIVQVKGNSDFIAAKPASDEYANVGAILLDPSCSGTGIVGRDDAIKMHLPDTPGSQTISQKPERGKKRKRGDEATKGDAQPTLNLDMDDSTPEETPVQGKLTERLAALSSFQLHILTHAMRFESAHKITYSTCSIHFEENEGVVFQALASSVAKERGWRILKRDQQAEGLQKWHRRGIWEEDKIHGDLDESFKKDVLEACIRCDKDTEEGTMGFFVAAFVREGDQQPAQGTEVAVSEDEEWGGFSDHGEVEETVAPVIEESESRKKKKRKHGKNNSELSRPRLKEVTKWIRDELDLRVARDGPDVLQPDDIITLHEIFLALQNAKHITLSDLRASGIHRAVKDIAGVATRWPGRLCDDCDTIIDIWTAKFGSLNAIHPFLYGRGGRLEGIASVHEQSRDLCAWTNLSEQALLKRWAKTCPQNIHPKRSHRLGDLGFVAGSWWINPLFAHHAGIIGLESCDGGTTYDKYGAYALLLKDTGELEASCESRFTYRVPQKDKGKFRLTSATPRSRDPVRVLRSHSINSIWGPKAGVRYEGVYSVKGWSIKQAKSTDTSGEQWKEGDILFDVRFERADQTPMGVVINRPTATEIDDYAEYKRLRKLSQHGKEKEAKAAHDNQDHHPTPKAVHPIMPPYSPYAAPKPLAFDLAPSALRKDMVKRLHFDEEAHVHVTGDDEALSPKTNNTLAIPSGSNRQNIHARADLPSNGPDGRSSQAGSNASSAHTTQTTHTAASNLSKINVREVAPWIDFDANLTIPEPSEEPLIIHQRPIIAQTNTTPTGSPKAHNTGSPKHQSREHLYSPIQSTLSSIVTERYSDDRQARRHEGDFKGMLGEVLSPQHTVKKEKRSEAPRKKNLMTKLFDGILDDDNSKVDGSSWETKTSFFKTDPAIPRHKSADFSTSWKQISQPFSHVFLNPCSAESQLKLPRSNDIGFVKGTAHLLSSDTASNNVNTSISTSVPNEEPFIENPTVRRQNAMPISMKILTSQPSSATTVSSAICTPILGRPNSSLKHTDERSLAETNLRKMIE
ncbi:hypothetical protein COCHEDRAFT_1191617 [Bipolaris maydis C5]|uniref:SAM-dependent MTase RsmB/NOP-type domain-containing protein n=1 Tax=Cochliobolus heterostrophus (strain C5 / ATCC 48332 / race O) TaxID=701091 RepID=M2V4B0_COCH5|nr:hypothetical protein COCHEDRAFT_1191617 [Bipolaris maydis C5]KAJ6215014.1 hypothetical protein PSV09DRAFT_1191617 [Bipolaris maydis]